MVRECGSHMHDVHGTGSMTTLVQCSTVPMVCFVCAARQIQRDVATETARTVRFERKYHGLWHSRKHYDDEGG